MKNAATTLLAVILLSFPTQAQTSRQTQASSIFLEKVSWLEAEKALTPDAVVVIALGGASKEHGPHLPLSADFIQAEYVKDRVAERTAVVVAPSINYGFYPPMDEYPGSTTLRLSVSRDMVADICRSLARSSKARRFYIINHGVITNAALEQAASQLKAEGILFHYTDLEEARESAVKAVQQQEKGSHADEIETSMMLYMAPDMVEMKKAVREYGAGKKITGPNPHEGGRMIGNRPAQNGLYSPSGVFGDPTLATREKGRRITDVLVDATLKDIEELRRAALPPAVPLEQFFAGLGGEYEIAPGDTVTVSKEGDLLAVQRTGKPKALLQPVGKYRFGLWLTEARFFADGSGKATHLLLSAGGQDVIAKKIK